MKPRGRTRRRRLLKTTTVMHKCNHRQCTEVIDVEESSRCLGAAVSGLTELKPAQPLASFVLLAVTPLNLQLLRD